jgi:hypothetical protein
LDNPIVRSEVLNRDELTKGFAALAEAIRQTVMNCAGISLLEKKDLLNNLAS